MNPLTAQLTHRPFHELADAIRARVDRITLAWDAAVRNAMPQMQRLTFDELKDSTPEILNAIADALASDDPKLIDELISCAPAQGLSRLRLNFDLIEVMQEDRLLRSITVQHVEEGLDRRMDAAESAALHAAIDVMLQRSVIALDEQQKLQLRAAAETELKFLSFLTHDLNNNLNGITISLEGLGLDLKEAGGFAAAEESLALAQQYIRDTVVGMRRMLDHERLRKSANPPAFSRVDLYAAATKVVAQFAREAAAKGTKLSVEVSPGTIVDSDGELLALVLQNLVGNAVKYNTGGAIRVGFGAGANTDRQALWVSDDGPGIAPETIGHIFEAFRRGDIHGQPGLGLGLAIVSQAAKLLGAGLTVESRVGVGSTFRLELPHDAPNPFKTPAETAPLLVCA
ncbi:MAG TPA: HAMP domain-containing sensor histidine kinase [Humisphaera sp.]|nr:HAMP domain-containing sensor histidine kinase [Humisphaera sp.]